MSPRRGQNHSPRDAHVLILTTWDYKPLMWQRIFADAVQLRTLRWGVILDGPVIPIQDHKCPSNGQRRRGDKELRDAGRSCWL